MNKRYEALLALYPADQLAQMHRIKDALLDDPTALDNRHSEDCHNGTGKDSQEAQKDR